MHFGHKSTTFVYMHDHKENGEFHRFVCQTRVAKLWKLLWFFFLVCWLASFCIRLCSGVFVFFVFLSNKQTKNTNSHTQNIIKMSTQAQIGYKEYKRERIKTPPPSRSQIRFMEIERIVLGTRVLCCNSEHTHTKQMFLEWQRRECS